MQKIVKIEFDFDDESDFKRFVVVDSEDEAERIESNNDDETRIDFVVESWRGSDNWRYLSSHNIEKIEMSEIAPPNLAWLDWDWSSEFAYLNADKAFEIRNWLNVVDPDCMTRVNAVFWRSDKDESRFFGCC